jgi:hypothetical protein
METIGPVTPGRAIPDIRTKIPESITGVSAGVENESIVKLYIICISACTLYFYAL